ncbi:RNA pyrophosphohydrolase [Acidocella aquatica]|uniref:RNA pyrophosphohydrolase n=1 Tax=Acidocella aquatica TaxID=1922313 RepID=A0ABQ6A8J1_9PROT|nr:RNA pyrophosphohydrolase [Acidocella aquatica]GLR68800.1 RNA pyrophosphohydrolase [Acidocella aquatica]
MTDWMSLPYRMNVGAVLFGPDGRVLVGRRAGVADAAWQLPQGGIDEGEDPRTAVLRELLEEIGTADAEILAEHPDWLQYDFPRNLQRKTWQGRYRGQSQKWFALKFLGQDADVRLDAHAHPEFDAWKWVALAELPGYAVAFKRTIYEILARDFAHLAQP